MTDHDPRTILERWDITAEELTRLIDENPSIRGMLFGYVAEHHLHKWLGTFPSVSEIGKADDHDRTKKGDCTFVYKGVCLTMECKSLQTKSIKVEEGGRKTAETQVDGSDRREIVFPNGEKLTTTLLQRGEFDILAVNCFGFTGSWDYVFAKNSDLPSSTYAGYSEVARQSLLKSLVQVTWPPEPPFVLDPFPLMDQVIAERGCS